MVTSAIENLPADSEILPDDLSTCHELIRHLLAQLAQEKTLTAKMQHQLEKLLRHRFGQRADRLDPDNPGLFTKEEVEAILKALHPEATPPEVEKVAYEREKPKKGGHGRQEIPANLPRVREVVDVPEAEKTCGVCATEKVKIREEVSEQLEYRPASLYAKQTVRPVYACPKECEGQMAMAPAPLLPIPKCLAGPGLLAQIAVSKYGDHLPLNRQEDILSRHGVHISRQTQCDWMRDLARLLTPLYEHMKASVLSSKVVGTDDTPVKLQEEDNPKTKTARAWIYLDTIRMRAVFDFTSDRSAAGPLAFLGDFSGYLQADAYKGYDAFFSNGKAKEVACWAHARRYFFEAEKTAPALAGAAVSWIKLLFDVEDEAKAFRESLPRDCPAAERRARWIARRLELRQEKSKLLLKGFGDWLRKQELTALPKSPFGEAIAYTLSNWDALERYTEDGDLRIDNNLAEQAMRHVAVGRKNWLFFGSERGGRTWAILTSLIYTAKRHQVNLWEYMRDVIERIADLNLSELDQLLPDVWKQRRAQEAAATSGD